MDHVQVMWLRARTSWSPQEFISRIDECQVSNDCNDKTTFTNFSLCLRGEAEEWHSSKVHHLKLTAAQKTWHGFACFTRGNLQLHLTINSSLMDWPTWLTNQEKIQGSFSHGYKNCSTFFMRTTLPKESNQIDQPNSRLATTRRTHSPNMPTITSRHTTSSYLLKSSRPLPWKTFANFCPTRIKLASRWMMPKKTFFTEHQVEKDKHSILPSPLLSYVENEVLWIWPMLCLETV